MTLVLLHQLLNHIFFLLLFIILFFLFLILFLLLFFSERRETPQIYLSVTVLCSIGVFTIRRFTFWIFAFGLWLWFWILLFFLLLLALLIFFIFLRLFLKILYFYTRRWKSFTVSSLSLELKRTSFTKLIISERVAVWTRVTLPWIIIEYGTLHGIGQGWLCHRCISIGFWNRHLLTHSSFSKTFISRGIVHLSLRIGPILSLTSFFFILFGKFTKIANNLLTLPQILLGLLLFTVFSLWIKRFFILDSPIWRWKYTLTWLLLFVLSFLPSAHVFLIFRINLITCLPVWLKILTLVYHRQKGRRLVNKMWIVIFTFISVRLMLTIIVASRCFESWLSEVFVRFVLFILLLCLLLLLKHLPIDFLLHPSLYPLHKRFINPVHFIDS